MSESRLVIIDGYNLIHRSPELKPGPRRTLRQSRDKLLNLLAWALGGGEAHFLVVFDGAEGGGAGARDGGSGRVEVRYSRPPETADDLIRRLVEDRVERVDRLTVVTSDVEVARHARAMGADISISDLFLASALGPTHPGQQEQEEKPTTLTRKELEEWAELFRRGRPGPDTGNAPEGEPQH
jgi:predicted RNA-binding protein with PIN domain